MIERIVCGFQTGGDIAGARAARGISDLSEYVAANLGRLADVLDTVLIGDVAQRQDVESMLAMLDEDQRAPWLAERHERRRTSMNDIGGRAAALAESLRKKEALQL